MGCCVPLAAPTVSDQEAAATAELFRALGDASRVKIVNVLVTSEDPVCVCHLTEPLGLTQPTVSHHLKVLRDAGLVESSRRGTSAFYRLVPGAVRELRHALGG